MRLKRRRSDRSTAFFELMVLLVFGFMLIMVFATIFNKPQYVRSNPEIIATIFTDKTVYQFGETVTIRGNIQIISDYKNLLIRIYIFDWSDGSSFLIVESAQLINPIMTIQLTELNYGKSLQWISNKTSEFGVKIHVTKADDPSIFSVAFLQSRFLVVNEKFYVDIYTDRLFYQEKQVISISTDVIPTEDIGETNIIISLSNNGEFIKQVYSGSTYLFKGIHVKINCTLSSEGLNGDYHLDLSLRSVKPEKTVLTKSTKFHVTNSTKSIGVIKNLISKFKKLSRYPDLLMSLGETQVLLNGLSEEDEQLLSDLIDIYDGLTESERKSLFIRPSLGQSYMTTGDLLYWLINNFTAETGLRTDDSKILLSYAAVFDDFFIREKTGNRNWSMKAWDEKKDSLIEWIKNYMIYQAQFFGTQRLREITAEYGVSGLIFMINPNFHEMFGDLQYKLIPIEAYEKVKKYAESMTCGNTLENILTLNDPPTSLDLLEIYIWNNVIFKFGASTSKPTTRGFYEGEVIQMLEGNKFPGNCVAVSRLIALIGRSLGMPIGIINPSESTGHWGNFKINEGKIIPDSHSQEMFESDKAQSNAKFIIYWPSLNYFNIQGFGLDETYKIKFGDKLPEFNSTMNLDEFVQVVSLEFSDITNGTVQLSGDIILLEENQQIYGYLTVYVDRELRGCSIVNLNSWYQIDIYLTDTTICLHRLDFILFSGGTIYNSKEGYIFSGTSNLPSRLDLHFATIEDTTQENQWIPDGVG